ncbi:MAG: oligoendopeptidase F [Treponema sp.]
MGNRELGRSEVDSSLTWDLSPLFKTDDDCLKSIEKTLQDAKAFREKYNGKIKTKEDVISCMKEFRNLVEDIEIIDNYVFLGIETDYGNAKKVDMLNKGQAFQGEVSGILSFVDTSISELSDDILKDVINTSKDDATYVGHLLKNKKHQLDAKVEEVLSYLSPVFSSNHSIYSSAINGDLKFPPLKVGNTEYPLTFTGFEGSLEYEVETEKRRASYEAFYNGLKQYENTLATNYESQMVGQKILASLRGYNNVFEYLLSSQDVTEEMYNRQLDIIFDKLSKHMRCYARLIQNIYDLDKMTFADLKLPIDPTYKATVTLEKAKEDILNAISLMGEDYCAFIKSIFENRRVDYVQNTGKASGAFCSSPYKRGSFILMSWAGVMADVYTLAHEAGHAGHFYLAGKNNNVIDAGSVSTYFVESPSTMHELLLSNYLIKNAKDDRTKRMALALLVSNTYYHNFVTHMLEGYFQRELYRLVQKGESVAPILSQLKLKTLRKFWGESVEIPDYAGLTWMRQPHYYMGLYSYTYSAGLTISTAASLKITKGEAGAVEQWKDALKAGGTLTPLEFAKKAGLDLTTDTPFIQTIEHIGSLIDEIIKLS